MNTKSNLLAALSISLLFLTQTAYADFRKALEAYQKLDGATMLKEVKDAVDKKNDDGLVLFLSVLELDSNLATYGTMYEFIEAPKDKRENMLNQFQSNKIVKTNWESLLGEEQKQAFLQLLEQASKSSLESQYRYEIFRKVNNYKLGLRGSSFLDVIKPKIDGLSDEAPSFELVEKGYKNAAFYYCAIGSNELSKKQYCEKAASLEHTGALLIQATNHLLGKKEWSITPDETKGLKLLRSALALPDASNYYYEIADDIGNYYLTKGDDYSLKQAYLWSLIALTYGHDPKSNPSSLVNLKKHRKFATIAGKKISDEWDISYQEHKNILSDLDRFYSFYGYLPESLKNIKQIKWPDLITQNRKIDLVQQPVISFHHFYPATFFGGHYNYIAGVTHYEIDIYEDGRVNFVMGNRIDRNQNIETIQRISKTEVADVVKGLQKLGFSNTPLFTPSERAINIGCIDCVGLYQLQNSLYSITLRGKNNERTLFFQNMLNEELHPTLLNIYQLFESKFQFQHFICGTHKKVTFYPPCRIQANK